MPCSFAGRRRHFQDKPPHAGLLTNRSSERMILDTPAVSSVKPIYSKKYESDDKNKANVSKPSSDEPRPVPRKLIVKRRVGGENTTKNSVGRITGSPKRWKKKKLSNKHPVEILDTLGQPILEVPRTPQLGKLPILNAASLLHTKSYSIKSATNSTISGLAATRRLLRGRHDFLQVVRKLLPTQKTFLLNGHGVPSQLLDEHIHLANDVLLHYDNATQCSFHSISDTVKRIRVRTGDRNQVAHWPPNTPRQDYSWDESLQLYFKVMQRMAKRFTDVLILAPPTNDPESTCTKDEYENEFDTGFMSSSILPHHWNVEFARASHAPPEPLIIVEFSPILQGPSAPGHLRLQLQGQPQNASRGRNNAVVMSVDAAFRWKTV